MEGKAIRTTKRNLKSLFEKNGIKFGRYWKYAVSTIVNHYSDKDTYGSPRFHAAGAACHYNENKVGIEQARSGYICEWFTQTNTNNSDRSTDSSDRWWRRCCQIHAARSWLDIDQYRLRLGHWACWTYRDHRLIRLSTNCKSNSDSRTT